MKIFVFNLKTTARSLAMIVFAVVFVMFAGIAGIEALGTIIEEKQLPVYSVECPGQKAAITFDCAWGAEDIPEILDVLKKEDVKATFFIVGQWAEKYPEIVKMISDAGHDIGNHGYSHLRMGGLDRQRTLGEIGDCTAALEKLTGKTVELFRPPYGDYTSDLVTAAKSLKLYTVQWNVDSLDWKPGISIEEIMQRISSRMIPGSILLFHNSTPHTAKMLPDIIKLLKGGGYELVPVSSLILREDYTIDYEGRQHPADDQRKQK